MRGGIRNSKVVKAAVGAVVLGCLAFTPAPFLFVCACTCGTGLPVNVPEAPWMPALLVVGIGAVLLMIRRRGGGRGPGGTDDRRSRRPRMRRRLGLAFTALIATSVVMGAATAAAATALPPVAVTPACDCPPGPTSGVLGTSTGDSSGPNSGVDALTTPKVGSASNLEPGLIILAAGGALIGSALIVRGRRRVLIEREVDENTQL